MASSNGGSVTLRLALAGAPEVKAALAALGPAGRDALRQIEQATRAPSQGLQALNVITHDAKAKMEELAESSGTVGRALAKLGPAGLATAIGVGIAVEAIRKLAEGAKEAGDWAETLTLKARALNLTTTQLQEYREAGEKFRIENAAMDDALTNLNVTFSKLRSGVQDVKIKKVLTDLVHIDPADLKSIPDAAGFMLRLSDAIHNTQDQATKLQIVRAFNIEPLLPLLDGGHERLQHIISDTHQFGEVLSGQLVQGMSAQNSELREMDQRLEASSRRVHSVMIPALVEFKREIAEINSGLADAVDWLKRLFGADQLLQQGRASIATRAQQATTDAAALRSGSIGGSLMAMLHAQGTDFTNIATKQGRESLARQFDQDAANANAALKNLDTVLAAQNRITAALAGAKPPAGGGGGGGGGGGNPDGGAGSAGGGSRSSGPSQADLAAKREELDLQMQLDIARARGDAIATKALQDRLDLLAKIKQLEDAGYSHAQALKIASGYIAEKDAAESAHKAAEELKKEFEDSRASFSKLVEEVSAGLEKTRQEEEKLAQDRANASAKGISSALQALYHGDASGLVDNFMNKLFDSIGQSITSALPAGMQSFIGQIFGDSPLTISSSSAAAGLDAVALAANNAAVALGGSAATAGAGGGGGFLSFLSSIFGGHADGTSYSQGGLKVVGEKGWEFMRVPRGAQVFDHSASIAMARMGMNDNGPMLMMANPIRQGAGGWGEAPVEVHYHGTNPVKARQSTTPGGGRKVDLYEIAGRDMINQAGASGDLMRAVKRSPAPKRRGR